MGGDVVRSVLHEWRLLLPKKKQLAYYLPYIVFILGLHCGGSC